jgi:hypothetical protein
MTLDPLLFCRTSEIVLRRFWENMGLVFAGKGAEDLPALDAYGTLRNATVTGSGQIIHAVGGQFNAEPGPGGCIEIGFWLYSPRSLVSLLAEPDLPELDVQVENGGRPEVYVNGKLVGFKGLPLEKGWNHFSIRICRPSGQRFSVRFSSGKRGFLQTIVSSVSH